MNHQKPRLLDIVITSSRQAADDRPAGFQRGDNRQYQDPPVIGK